MPVSPTIARGPDAPPRRWRSLLAALFVTALAALHLGLPPTAMAANGSGQGRSGLAAVTGSSTLMPGEVGMIALPIAGGRPLFEHNAARAFNPASTMKLVTAYAALSLLGPEYRWRTALYLGGRLEEGTLRGDLIVRGGGDPKLVIEDLSELIGRMMAGGLRRIEGDLVLDDSLYDLSAENLAPLDGDASQPYNVAPNAALFNFKAVEVTVRVNGQGSEVVLDPALAGVGVVNEVRIKAGDCALDDAFTVADAGDEHHPAIRVGGMLHSGCGELAQFSAVLDHRHFVRALFKAAWETAGGTWAGGVRVVRGAAQGVPWLVWESPRSLAQVIEDINKNSNNLIARQVLLQVAAEVAGRPATVAHARAVVGAWLESQGLRFPELVIDNGSGLSRDARISARSLARLLVSAANGPYADLMRLTLPLAGVDGTMKRRLTSEELTGKAWIKTGSLEGVRAIAGYVDAISGQRYVVVMIVNGAAAGQTRSAQDGFMRWVYNNG